MGAGVGVGWCHQFFNLTCDTIFDLRRSCKLNGETMGSSWLLQLAPPPRPDEAAAGSEALTLNRTLGRFSFFFLF